jgi:Na+-transporting methylmalonyl-CoA/oxaloacetate decarboxylase gamma subunit
MTDRASIFLLVTILVLVTIILIYAMKSFSDFRKARLQIESEDAYRELAERVVRAQEGSAAALAALLNNIQQIETRTATIEKVLKEVG